MKEKNLKQFLALVEFRREILKKYKRKYDKKLRNSWYTEQMVGAFDLCLLNNTKNNIYK